MSRKAKRDPGLGMMYFVMSIDSGGKCSTWLQKESRAEAEEYAAQHAIDHPEYTFAVFEGRHTSSYEMPKSPTITHF